MSLNFRSQDATTGRFAKTLNRRFGVFSLTDGATISVDAAKGSTFDVTLAGNRTIAAPSNAKDGQTITFRLKQDGTGSRTITWNAIYRFTGGTAPTLTTTAAKTDYVRFRYNAAATKWDCEGTSLNL